MPYISEILACRWIKDPVKMYIYTIARDEYEFAGREFSEALARKMQKERRAYLSKISAFDDEEIVYADSNPSEALKAHEEWHHHLQKKDLVSPEGDFIEEATANVIEAYVGGYVDRFREVSEESLPKQRLVQKCRGIELEKELDIAKEKIFYWDEKVMKGSCPWLWYIENAKYLLLYALCADLLNGRTLNSVKKIYMTAMKRAKRGGVKYGINHLRKHASPLAAKLYDFDFDVGGYFPDALHEKKYSFFDGKLKIEAYYTYRTWLEPLEMEIRRRKFK
ncbi:MAG: hypothetical protein QME12_03785 [Nanoarchaeota archaeon]|nr:hypothetical protein [Nanoarchaeota archaeon]